MESSGFNIACFNIQTQAILLHSAWKTSDFNMPKDYWKIVGEILIINTYVIEVESNGYKLFQGINALDDVFMLLCILLLLVMFRFIALKANF